MDKLQKKLFEMQDISYRDFQSKLMPTVPPNKIIGIRTPVLRKFAKEFYKSGEYKEFLENLPHTYYEEDNLHALLIQEIKDFPMSLTLTETFLPYVDNWATCDMFTPKIFRKNKEKILTKAYEWCKSNHTYTIRYGIKVFMDLFLDDDFCLKYIEEVAAIRSDEYYVKMMVAWYFATALAKQYKTAITYIENNKLDCWMHNKAIQKAIESYRIDTNTKDYLKTLKRKPEVIK